MSEEQPTRRRVSATTVHRKIRGLQEEYPDLIPFGQLSIGLFWVLFFLGIPMVIIFYYSFLQNAPPTGAIDVTLDNYVNFLSSPLYVEVLLDSLVIAIKTTVVTLLLAYPPAYYLAFTESKYKNIFLLLMILPFWINIVIRTYAWRLILGPTGVINYFLLQLGLVDTPVRLLYSQNAITIGLVHILLPFMIIPLYTSLNDIDPSHIEAAKNLGANDLEAFYEVTLPQSLPGISAGVMLVFVLAFGSFLTPILLGGPQHSMIANLIASMFRSIGDWGLGSAMAVIFVTVVLSFVYVFNRLIGLEELYEGGA